MNKRLASGFLFISIFVMLSISCQATTPTPTPTTKPTSTPPSTPIPSPVPNSGSVGVNISGFAFVQATVTITVGTTVTWTNRDSAPHTVTSRTELFDSGNLNRGDSFSYTFQQKGTFEYYCKIHPYMTGKIIVE